MPLSSFPLIGWGNADDLSTTGAANCNVSSGFTDPFGGTGGYKLTSTVAGGRRTRSVTYLADGIQYVLLAWKADTAAKSSFFWRDNTASLDRGGVTVTWGGGLSVSGGASVLGTVSLGAATGPWTAVLASCSGIIKANSNSLDLYPDYNSGVAGSAFFYLRNMVLLDLLDEAISWEEDREGTTYERGPSGFRDTARIGLDQLLEGRVRWVPKDHQVEGPVSGYYGENEGIGVNCGIKAMLRAGRESQLLRWVPDRSACNIGQDAYLDAPLKGKPDIERGGQRAWGFRLIGSSVFTGL